MSKVTLKDMVLQLLPSQLVHLVECVLLSRLLKLFLYSLDLLVDLLENLSKYNKDNSTDVSNANYKVGIKLIKCFFKLLVKASDLVQSAVKWQHKNELARPIRYDTIVESEHEITASAVAFRPVNKEGRKLTRTFLSYVEQHDLRFRLLRAADVGVSLVKQYITLLLTYLITLLQFGKLIDNNHAINLNF
ncbi:hypothetical protein EVAR_18889_1 [Eumeta japonica]|uniref:Uncharacterized protein n=1 Tax=Eumeta variegata TaxID=151549 RepID=A0A4C1V386_EUMVA|nr:hypothetical protein EVAR_18889_1 [Eumeta japonica]